METTQDKVLSVVYALALHVGVIGMLFVTLLRQPLPQIPDDEGPAIEATLVSSPQQSTAAAKAVQAAEQKVVQPSVSAPPPQPTPEPKPKDAPQPQQLAPQVQLPKPDTVNQDEVRREAELAAMQKARQEQEERRKQEQVDLTNKLQQQEEAQNRQRLAQQQLDQQQKVEQQQKIAKELAAAARDVKLKEEAMKQLQDRAARVAQDGAQPVAAARQVPPTASPGVMTWNTKQKLALGYMQAIREVANANWHHDNIPERVHCNVRLKQLVGGEVVNVDFVDCPFDATGRATVEAALERTPLPYAGFESVFNPEINIDMCYPEEACK
jgi:colicin import membrane protein